MTPPIMPPTSPEERPSGDGLSEGLCKFVVADELLGLVVKSVVDVGLSTGDAEAVVTVELAGADNVALPLPEVELTLGTGRSTVKTFDVEESLKSSTVP
jgi:hypothetical protein